MEETLSLPVNRSFDKRAVCTKSGQEPLNSKIYSGATACIATCERLKFPQKSPILHPKRVTYHERSDADGTDVS